jgi:uncharacterized protein DUF5069
MTDLRVHPPRRWNESLAGLIWLPRLIDKIRAFQAGTLGTYAYPSALDRAFMRRFQLNPAFLEQAVREQATDIEIGTTVLQRIQLTAEEIRGRCMEIERRYHLAFCILDCDDGYVPGLGYPVPRFLQPHVWRWYQRWAAQKASVHKL